MFVRLFKKQWHLAEKIGTMVEGGMMGGEDIPLPIT
jgi:hypothetical protein